jgi:hypothetical protein
MKSKRIWWTGHVARMGEGRKVYRVLVGRPKERGHLKDQGAAGNMGSKWILGQLAGRVWCGFNWLRMETGGGLLCTR